ncbi:2689_t:CDS:2, partial [Gigaspora margarita]
YFNNNIPPPFFMNPLVANKAAVEYKEALFASNNLETVSNDDSASDIDSISSK